MSQFKKFISGHMVMCSPPRPHALLSLKLLSMFVVSRVCFVLSMSLKSNHAVIGYPPKSHITIAPLGTSCLMSHCFSRHSLQLSKIADEFSPSAAHIVPSSIRKVYQQGVPSSPLVWFLNVLKPKGMVSTRGSYHLDLLIKSNGSIMILFGWYWELCPKSPRECYLRHGNRVLVRNSETSKSNIYSWMILPFQVHFDFFKMKFNLLHSNFLSEGIFSFS